MKTRQYDMPSVVLKSGFENCMVKDIKSDILSKMPHIDEDWLDFTAGISGLVYTAFEVFISEAKKGHIFCDDLFRSTLKKYCKTYIPTEWDSSALIKQYFDNNENFKDISWNTIYSNSSNITYLLICYDFCCNFMTQFYPTIEQIYHVDLNVNGFTKKVMLSGYYDWSMLIMQEMKNNAKDIIQKMEHPINFPYIHTTNNLAEVLARLPKLPEPKKVPSRKASLPLDDDLRITVTGPAKGKKAEPKSAPTTIFDNPSSRPKGFAALAGMTELKEKFRSDIIDVIREQERARALNITLPNGALLYGPPGCGKTFFAEKLAEEAGCNFILVNCSDIASSFIHGTQKLIAEKFAEAEENKPSIIFFDEIDAMIPKRNARGSEYTKTEVNEFLTQLNHCGRKGIIAIGATNRPQDVDEAALRSGRLELKYYLPQPDKETRTVMFGINLNHTSFRGSIDLDKLADMTEDYVSADIERIVAETKRAAFRKKLDYITMDMLEETIRTTRPSVTKDTIKECEAIRNKFEGRKPEYQRIGFC